MRADLFARQPLCEECLRQGRTTLATQRDHRISLEEGGADDSGPGSNEQALCQACHDAKSKLERERGQRRARGEHG